MKHLNKKQIEEIKALLLHNKEVIETVLHSIEDENMSLSDMDLNDEADFAAASRDYATDVNIKHQQVHELEEMVYALKKMEDNTYDGLCEMCDSEITMARLRVKPHAKYCIECRQEVDKNL